MKDNYIPTCSYGKTPLTREYFKKNNWEISYPKTDNGETIWLASLNKTCDDCFGRISLQVSNCMYDWRFSMSGEVNGHGEGYFHGTIFVCTVEELETFLFDIAHIAWDYRIKKKDMNKYTIYCTPEQAKKALELGAPIDFRNGDRPYISVDYLNEKMYIEKACEQFDEAITQLGLDYLISDKVMADYCSKFRKAMEE